MEKLVIKIACIIYLFANSFAIINLSSRVILIVIIVIFICTYLWIYDLLENRFENKKQNIWLNHTRRFFTILLTMMILVIDLFSFLWIKRFIIEYDIKIDSSSVLLTI